MMFGLINMLLIKEILTNGLVTNINMTLFEAIDRILNI